MTAKGSLKAHYPDPPAGEYLVSLKERLDPAVSLTTGPDQSVAPDTDILIAGRPTREQLSASQNLRTLIIPWAGLSTETRRLMVDFPGIAVHNLHHNARPVAEMMLTLLLSAAKLVIPFDKRLRQNDWTPRYQPSPALLMDGKTALILGYGTIGQLAAGYCKALGMRVLAIRRTSGKTPAGPADKVHTASDLCALLPQANALLICLPHTPQTDGLIGQQELALLPAQAILVNVGRGPIVDEAALFTALQSGRLHSAGLDVWYDYPPDEMSRSNTGPASHPFHELDNVVMSPHRAGSTAESNSLRMANLANLLNEAARGNIVPNRVDLAAGY